MTLGLTVNALASQHTAALLNSFAPDVAMGTLQIPDIMAVNLPFTGVALPQTHLTSSNAALAVDMVSAIGKFRAEQEKLRGVGPWPREETQGLWHRAGAPRSFGWVKRSDHFRIKFWDSGEPDYDAKLQARRSNMPVHRAGHIVCSWDHETPDCRAAQILAFSTDKGIENVRYSFTFFADYFDRLQASLQAALGISDQTPLYEASLRLGNMIVAHQYPDCHDQLEFRIYNNHRYLTGESHELKYLNGSFQLPPTLTPRPSTDPGWYIIQGVPQGGKPYSDDIISIDFREASLEVTIDRFHQSADPLMPLVPQLTDLLWDSAETMIRSSAPIKVP